MEPCPYKEEFTQYREHLARLPAVCEKIDGLKEDVGEIRRALFGNGQPSMATKVALLEVQAERIENELQSRADSARDTRRFHRRLIVAVVAALMSSLLPWVLLYGWRLVGLLSRLNGGG